MASSDSNMEKIDKSSSLRYFDGKDLEGEKSEQNLADHFEVFNYVIMDMFQ